MKPAFKNRGDAGERLAALLATFKQGDAIVLAIPAGGVPVAAAIARSLGLRMQVAPVSKVLLPWTTESGFGAVAFDGSAWIDQRAVDSYGLKQEQVDRALADAHAKVERRNRRFNTALRNLAGRTVIVVDDGVAAGSTMRTAIAALRKQGVAAIVVAVPTGHEVSLQALRKLADEVVCADIRGGPRFAVADAYEEWYDLSDDDVEVMLRR